MRIGRVVGTVVASAKDERLEGLKLQVVQVVGTDAKESSEYVVAADSVGAGQGEIVLFATGSSARQTLSTDGRPVDAVIMAIVDEWDVDGAVIYKKDESIITAEV